MITDSTCQTCGTKIDVVRSDGVCAICLFGDALDHKVNEMFGGHELHGVIARGGMGVVYRAMQREPRREVALKTLRGAELDSPEAQTRFRDEARTMAELEHPGILPIYQFGQQDGVLYFTMKLAAGGTLAERTAAYAGQWRKIAALIANVADAVQFAHEHGVLHRDIKPGNILFDEEGHTFVSDFGLAKLAENADGGFTGSAAMLGTPHYMAPEIAAHGLRAATTATDVWSLGVMLYELQAQARPFKSDSVPALMREITEREPDALAQTVPSDLRIIAGKALAKDTKRRYASARALADDLRCWLEGRPITARSVSGVERLWLWSRRNRQLAALAVVAILAVGWVGVSEWNNRVKLAKLRTAEREQLREALYERARLVRSARWSGWKETGINALKQAGSISPGSHLRDEAIAHLAGFDLQEDRGEGMLVVDGLRFDSQSHANAYKSQRELGKVREVRSQVLPDGMNLRIFDAVGDQEICTLPLADAGFNPSTSAMNTFSEDASALFFKDSKGTPESRLEIWQWNPSKLVREYLFTEGQVTTKTMRGEYIPYGTTTGAVGLINLRRNTQTRIGGHTGKVEFVTISQDKRLILSSGSDDLRELWLANDSQLLVKARNIGGRLAIRSDDRVYFVDHAKDGWGWIRRPTVVRFLDHPFGQLSMRDQIDFSPDGRLFVVAAAGGVAIGETASGLWLAKTTISFANLAKFSRDGTALFVVTNKGILNYPLHAKSGQITFGQPEKLIPPVPWITRTRWSSDRRWLSVTSGGGETSSTATCDLSEPTHTWRSEEVGGKFICSAPSPYGDWTVVCPPLMVIKRSGGIVPLVLQGGDVFSPALIPETKFSPDGRWLAVSGNGRLLVYDCLSWQLVHDEQLEEAADISIGNVVWSADSALLAAIVQRQQIKIWRSQSWENVASLESPVSRRALNVSFAQDSRSLATIRDGGSIEIWDLPKLSEELGRIGMEIELPAVGNTPRSPDGWSGPFLPLEYEPVFGPAAK